MCVHACVSVIFKTFYCLQESQWVRKIGPGRLEALRNIFFCLALYVQYQYLTQVLNTGKKIYMLVFCCFVMNISYIVTEHLKFFYATCWSFCIFTCLICNWHHSRKKKKKTSLDPPLRTFKCLCCAKRELFCSQVFKFEFDMKVKMSWKNLYCGITQRLS